MEEALLQNASSSNAPTANLGKFLGLRVWVRLSMVKLSKDAHIALELGHQVVPDASPLKRLRIATLIPRTGVQSIFIFRLRWFSLCDEELRCFLRTITFCAPSLLAGRSYPYAVTEVRTE